MSEAGSPEPMRLSFMDLSRGIREEIYRIALIRGHEITFDINQAFANDLGAKHNTAANTASPRVLGPSIYLGHYHRSLFRVNRAIRTETLQLAYGARHQWILVTSNSPGYAATLHQIGYPVAFCCNVKDIRHPAVTVNLDFSVPKLISQPKQEAFVVPLLFSLDLARGIALTTERDGTILSVVIPNEIDITIFSDVSKSVGRFLRDLRLFCCDFAHVNVTRYRELPTAYRERFSLPDERHFIFELQGSIREKNLCRLLSQVLELTLETRFDYNAKKKLLIGVHTFAYIDVVSRLQSNCVPFHGSWRINTLMGYIPVGHALFMLASLMGHYSHVLGREIAAIRWTTAALDSDWYGTLGGWSRQDAERQMAFLRRARAYAALHNYEAAAGDLVSALAVPLVDSSAAFRESIPPTVSSWTAKPDARTTLINVCDDQLTIDLPRAELWGLVKSIAERTTQICREG